MVVSLNLPFQTVCDGLAFPEGPLVLPGGDVLVTEIFSGMLTRVAPDGTKTQYAHPGGGPHGAAIVLAGPLPLPPSRPPLRSSGLPPRTAVGGPPNYQGPRGDARRSGSNAASVIRATRANSIRDKSDANSMEPEVKLAFQF